MAKMNWLVIKQKSEMIKTVDNFCIIKIRYINKLMG